jgi:tetratricopeptide (TPR) repeat protein
MLKRLAKTKPVILLIDDAQWLDESSKGLLKHLVREFPAGGSEKVIIIATSHDREILDDLGFDASSQAVLTFPTHERQVQILTQGVGLSGATAEQIVARLGSPTVEQGGLFWLLQVVANFARAGVLVPTDDGFALPDGKWPEDIFIPDEMRDILVDQLRRFPEYRMILECAACACDAREFSASVVAEALDRSRLQLLADLDRIDRDTSILYDVRERDDVFAFQSSFMLDVVRDELRIVHRGPASADVPQMIREYHARLGTVLEQRLETSRAGTYVVANHYYAAGAPFADRGIKYCLEAARASCAVLDFDAAENYLQRAAECAQLVGQSSTVEAERLDIECRRAHLTGRLEDHTRVANAGDAYLHEHPDCPTRLLLSIAQIHYDAGRSSGERSWFDRSVQIGQRIIDSAQSARDEAIGRHFVGISLPRGQRDDRLHQLREALRLMEAEPDDGKDFELLGRIMGSFAEELSRGTAEDRQQAKQLFERRLELNETHQVGDPRGQAMTHGGLGRLAFYYEPKDIATAAFHFQKDLDISEAIGDQQGQIQMHSLLGACALNENDLEKASDHYQRSWELSRHAINQFFAGAGLLSCHGRKHERDQFYGVVRRLLALADDGVPEICADDLVAALKACPPDLVNEEVEQLLDMAQEVLESR